MCVGFGELILFFNPISLGPSGVSLELHPLSWEQWTLWIHRGLWGRILQSKARGLKLVLWIPGREACLGLEGLMEILLALEREREHAWFFSFSRRWELWCWWERSLRFSAWGSGCWSKINVKFLGPSFPQLMGSGSLERSIRFLNLPIAFWDDVKSQ